MLVYVYAFHKIEHLIMDYREMNAPDEVHTFRKDSIPNDLFRSVQEFLDIEQFVDITLVSSDGKFISAHKLVLASHSEFFFQKLSQNLQSKQWIIEV